MHLHETQLAVILGAITFGFLCGFWLLPGGVLALRRLAQGQIQVDVRPGYRPATLYRLFELYGEDGTRAFRRMLLADMVFPAVYGALFFVLGDLSTSIRTTVHCANDVVRVMGVAAATFDYLENILLLFVIRHLPRRQPFAARLAGVCTSLKTASLFVALSALVIALVTR